MSGYRTAEKEFRPLGLKTRAIIALAGRNIQSIRDLAHITERDLSVIPGIGAKAIGQLRAFVQKNTSTIEVHERSRTVATVFEPACLTAIDAWGRENGMTSRPAVIRRLVALGLKAKRGV